MHPSALKREWLLRLASTVSHREHFHTMSSLSESDVGSLPSSFFMFGPTLVTMNPFPSAW
jgi:hypothetical protein